MSEQPYLTRQQYLEKVQEQERMEEGQKLEEQLFLEAERVKWSKYIEKTNIFGWMIGNPLRKWEESEVDAFVSRLIDLEMKKEDSHEDVGEELPPILTDEKVPDGLSKFTRAEGEWKFDTTEKLRTTGTIRFHSQDVIDPQSTGGSVPYLPVYGKIIPCTLIADAKPLKHEIFLIPGFLPWKNLERQYFLSFSGSESSATPRSKWTALFLDENRPWYLTASGVGQQPPHHDC